MLSLVCQGEVGGGCCGVSRAVLRWQITAEIQGVIRMFWRCDKRKCARAVAGTAFSSGRSFALRGNSNRSVKLWGHCRGFSYRCNSSNKHNISVLPPFCPFPTSYPTSNGVCPAATVESIAVPFLAWQPFPFLAGEGPWPDPRSALGRSSMGHHLNASVEDPPFPHIPPIPLQFPSWSPDLRFLPLFTPSNSLLCFLKMSPFPTLPLHPLG